MSDDMIPSILIIYLGELNMSFVNISTPNLTSLLLISDGMGLSTEPGLGGPGVWTSIPETWSSRRRRWRDLGWEPEALALASDREALDDSAALRDDTGVRTGVDGGDTEAERE